MGLLSLSKLGHILASPLLLWLLCSLCGAQNQSDQDLMSLNLEDLGHVKVYSASRHMEDVRDAPSSVSIVTAEQIRRYGWRTLADVLRSLRGFYTSYDRTYAYLGVRGFLRPGDYDSRILLLLNGHRLNDNVYDTANIGTDFPLDLDLIDHIEVVRGPGSSLFGTNAVFGVINVITRSPASTPSVEVAGDISSFFSRTGRVTVNGSRGRLSGLISGSMYESAGPSPLFFPEFAALGMNHGLASNIDGDRYAHLFSQLQYGNLRVQALYSGRRKIIPTGSYETNFNDPGTRVNDSDLYLDIDYQRILSAKTTLDLRAYQHHYGYEGTYAYGGTGSPERYLNYDSSVAAWSGLEATLNRDIGPHHLTLGATYEYSFRVNQKTFDAGLPPMLNDHRTPWFAAGYGEAQFKLRHDFVLHAGGRFDYFKDYGAAFSPRAALVYSPNSRTTLKYIYGRAFRAPNAYESFYSDGVSTELPPQTLQKENIQSHEVVFDRSLTTWLGITLDGYFNQLDHLIDWVQDPANGLSHSVNLGRVRGRGLELEFNASHRSGVQGRASYSVGDAIDTLNEQALNNSPRQQGKLNVIFPATRHAFLSLESQYTSAQQSYWQTRVPPSFLNNVTVSTRPLWGGWEFSGSCYNALDRRWFSPMGPSDSLPAIQQDGRPLRFKVSYRFSRESKASIQ
jgi:outer membrane receptor protein involved in Fe transport